MLILSILADYNTRLPNNSLPRFTIVSFPTRPAPAITPSTSRSASSPVGRCRRSTNSLPVPNPSLRCQEEQAGRLPQGVGLHLQWIEAHQRSCTDARRPVAQAGSSLPAAQSGAYVLEEGPC